MKRATKFRLGLCAATLGGLVVYTGLRADDPPAKNDKAPAAKAEAPKAAPKPVQPKPLSDSVKKGLEYLAKNQLENGGFLNISETLLARGGEDWEKWDKAMTASINQAQDKDGSWAGHHCITGKTFCTAGALLVLMADRAPVPACAKAEKKEEKK
jgi:hypothetical protein